MPTLRSTLALVLFIAAVATPQLAAQVADLTAVKSGPSEAAAGDDVPYSVTITNLGEDPAVNVTIVDNVPAGMTFVSATQTGGPAAVCTTPAPGDSGTVTCTVAELAPNASLDFTFVFNIPPTTPGETTFTNVVTFTSDTFDPNEENNIGVASTTTPAPPQADLTIEKNGPGAVGPGTTFSFTIALANGGPSDAVNVTLQDAIPGDLQFVSLVQESGPALNCTTPAVGAGGTITCTAATFAAGAEALFTLTTSVPADTASGTTYTNTAFVTSDNDPTEENDAATWSVIVSDVDLSVVKNGTATVVAGGDITYTITVANAGPDAATTVQLTDVLPEGTTFVSLVRNSGPAASCSAPPVGTHGTVLCTFGFLGGSASAQFTLVVRTGGDIASATNTATVTSENFDRDTTNNTDDAVTTVTPNADLRIVKSGPAAINAGANITYTIALTNDGLSEAQSVSISDPLPTQTTFVALTQTSGAAFSCTTPAVGAGGTVTCTAATLAAGESASFELIAAVASSATGSLENTVAVSSATPDSDATDNTSTSTAAINVSADVKVDKTAPATTAAGETLTYTITVANDGPADAASVELNDVIPAQTTFASLTQTNGPTASCTTPAVGATGTVTCTFATLSAGASATFSLGVAVPANASGSIDNTASLTTTTADPDMTDNSDTATSAVVASADVAATKTGPASATAGTSITYTLTAANNGPSDAANVTLTDVLPAGTTFVALVQNSGPAFTCSTPAAGANGTITCTIATFSAGDSAAFTLEVTAGANVTAPIDNTLTIGSATADPDPSNNSDTETTPVTVNADLAATKSGPVSATAGTTISYTLTAANNGPSNAATVTLTDVLPAGTTFASLVQNSGPAFACTTPAAGANGTITCTIATFNAADAASFTLEVNVGSDVTASIDNTVTIGSASGDANPANNSDTETTPVNVSADVAVSKSGPASATAGTNITYTIVASNNGPSDATNVTLTDVLPAQTTFVSVTQTAGPAFNCTGTSTVTCNIAMLARGASATFTLVVQAAPGASGTIGNTATIASTSVDPQAENNQSTATTAIAASADVRVVKSGPAGATAGANVTYTIVVANDGPSDSQNVTLTDVIPAQTTLVSATQTAGPAFTCTGTNSVTCTTDTLANGASATFELTLAIAPDATGTINNTAEVTAATTDPNAPNNQSTVATTVGASADLGVTKTAPATAAAGTNITYTIAVANNGPSSATNVVLSDVLPAQTSLVSVTQTAGPAFTCSGTTTVTCSAASFAAGASATFSIEVQLRPDASGAIANTATISSATPDPEAANNTSTASTTATAASDVSVTKTAPATATAGSTITYTVVVANNGPSDAATVTLTDALPAQTTFVSLTQSGPAFTCTTGSTVTCSIATLPATTSTTFTIEVLVAANASGTLDNTATVTSATADPNNANNTSTAASTVGNAADLAVTKTAPAGATAGSTITYTVVVANNGPSDAATVTLTDVLPAQTTFVSLTQSGPAFTCTTGSTITCSIATLPATTSTTFTIEVLVAANASGTLDNTATVTSATADPDNANNTSTATTALGSTADLAVTKTAPPAATEGSNITYTVTAVNNGPSDATNVVLTDVLPTDTVFVSATQTAGPAFTCTTPAAGANGTITCTIGTFAAASSATFSFVVSITPGANGPVTNTATLTSDTPDPTPANSAGTASTAIATASTDLSIAKTANAGNYNPGASATYTIVVTNNGPATATGTTVTDVLPAGTTLTSATSTQGTCSGTSTVTCNVGTLAANATATITLMVTLPTTPGAIQNTATVSSDQGELTPANNTSSTTIAIIPAAPAGIPTLTPLAMALMALSMAMTVMVLLRAK